MSPAALERPRFLGLGYTDLAAWRAWVDYPFDVRAGQGALRVWTDLERGKPVSATTDLALADFRASLADELSPLELASVQGRVQARALADGVELAGRGLAVVLNGPEVPRTDFSIVWRPQAGGAVTANVIELDSLARVAGALPCRRSSPRRSKSSRRAAAWTSRASSGGAVRCAGEARRAHALRSSRCAERRDPGFSG